MANAIATLVLRVEVARALRVPTSAAIMDGATEAHANATMILRVLPATKNVAHWDVPTMAYVPLILNAIVRKDSPVKVVWMLLVPPIVRRTACV